MLDKKISRCDEVIVNLQMMIQTTLPLSVSVPTGPPESTAVPEPPGAPKPAYGEQKPASGEPEHVVARDDGQQVCCKFYQKFYLVAHLY